MVSTAVMYGLLFASLYFEVFLLVSFLERRRGRAVQMASINGPLPSVAVVVPCYNEGASIAGTIQSLLALQYPKDKLEILVVDDGSTDNTLAVARTFESDRRVKVFHKENGGKHSAMNYGLARTNAEYIGCLDADSIVQGDALLRIIAMFNDKQVAAITPGIHVRSPKSVLQHLQHVEYRLSLFNRFILAALGSVFITPGPFSIFRSSVIRELGGWRYAHSTEDMEMALRIQAAGYLIGNAPTAVVYTTTPATLRKLFHQRVRWTYGWLRNAIDYRYMIGNRRFGHLGIIILPSALISIGAGMYFFIHVLWSLARGLSNQLVRIEVTGHVLPSQTFELFYLNTSTVLFLIAFSVAIVLTLIILGSYIGTGRRMPPAATPLFLLFYSFLAPLWLCAAFARAVFNTGVRWR